MSETVKMQVKFPSPETARENGWTHQVNYEAHNGEADHGPDIWVPCFHRLGSKEHAEQIADDVRQDPMFRNVKVHEIPQEPSNG